MTTTYPKAKGNAYALFWLEGDTAEDLVTHTLIYRGPGRAEVRTYYKGHLDPRAGDEDEFPRFEEADDAMHWMYRNRGKKCLIAVHAALRIRKDAYAEPV